MAIANVSSGTGTAGTTSSSPTYPATVTAGEMLILVCVHKYSSAGISTPSGWTLLGSYTGGTGDGNGAGTGSGKVWIFYRIADGTEDGATLSVTISPTANCSYHRIFSFSKDGAKDWDIALQGGNMDTPATAWSITTGSWNVAAGDHLIAASFQNIAITDSAQACSMSGITFGTATELNDAGSTAGDDVRMIVSSHPVSSGSNTAALTYTMTVAGSVNPFSPAGATAVVRLREVDPPASSRRIFIV